MYSMTLTCVFGLSQEQEYEIITPGLIVYLQNSSLCDDVQVLCCLVASCCVSKNLVISNSWLKPTSTTLRLSDNKHSDAKPKLKIPI